MARRSGNTFLRWLPLAVAITILAGLVYATVQQSLRQGANDPQIQLAEDTAAAWLLALLSTLVIMFGGNILFPDGFRRRT
jgi:hypothetical protein